MDASGASAREPLGALLGRLRSVVRSESDALAADDFNQLEQLGAERAALVAALDGYTPTDAEPADRALLEQVAALDQQLVASARAEIERTARELGEVHRGRGALEAYRRRGQALIGGLADYDLPG